MESKQSVKVVLVDDHSVVRKGLSSLLSAYPEFEVVGEAGSGEELLANLETWLPEVVVMDVLMPGGISGIEATEEVRKLSPTTQVVVLTAYTDDARVVAALRAGGIGYVGKDGDLDILIEAIRAAKRGQSTLDPQVAGSVLHELVSGSGTADSLTEREMTVLQELARGQTNKEIAESLSISLETVKTHVANILSKLHQAHRMKAVIVALKRGIISLDDLDV